ncbi:MAG: hypothetical protein M3Y91_08880 [Actinomycetota bacterium]|nr:hypothetical protein [Actinomycetota bacterium]
MIAVIVVLGLLVVGVVMRPGLFRPVAWLVRTVGWLLLAAGAITLATSQPISPVGAALGFVVAVGLIAAGRRSGRALRRRSDERWASRRYGRWDR